MPIIFISSASDNMNIVMAMNMGADDFISKPFEEHKCTNSKVQALLRRPIILYLNPYNRTPWSHLNTGDGSFTYEGKRIELSKNEHENPSHANEK